MESRSRKLLVVLGVPLVLALGNVVNLNAAETTAATAPQKPADAPRSEQKGRSIQAFELRSLDQTPVPKFQARPQYPPEMRKAGIAGEVVVDFIVDTNGDVQNAYALRSSKREFEAAAVAAVSKWKFRPGRKGGRDVPTHMQVPIVFSLNTK